MFCQQCGKPIDAGVRYCPHCGAKVSEQAPPPSAAPGKQPPAVATAKPPVGQYAGFGVRLAAYFIDFLIVQFVSFAICLPVAFGMGFLASDGAVGVAKAGITGLVFITLSRALFWLYEALSMSSHWQATVGKKALGIVVTDENGGRISFLRATGRHFGKWLSELVLCAGYLIQPFTPQRQALHDILARTLAVKP